MNTTEVISILKQMAASASPNAIRELRAIAEDVYFSGNSEYAVSALRFVDESDPNFGRLLSAIQKAKAIEEDRKNIRTDFD